MKRERNSTNLPPPLEGRGEGLHNPNDECVANIEQLKNVLERRQSRGGQGDACRAKGVVTLSQLSYSHNKEYYIKLDSRSELVSLLFSVH